CGEALIIGGGRVDLELTPLGDSCRVVTLPVYSPTATVLLVARPGNDEVAISVHCHVGVILVVTSAAVDAKLATLSHTACVVALRVDAIAASVLCTARPSDDKVAS